MRVVTIDGPAGAGKSTVAKRVAERLKWRFLDTGAMYRAVTLAASRRGVPLSDEKAVSGLAAELHVALPPGRVLLGDEDVSEAIRTPHINALISPVADNAEVRRILVGWQRTFASEYDTVTEGRDQGTIVFPGAFCKFFLTASIDERARRRHAELLARGYSAPEEAIREEILERDRRDQNRAIAPLKPAADALIVDTTGLDLEDVIAQVLDEIRRRLDRADSSGDAAP